MEPDQETKKWNTITGIAFAIALVAGAITGYKFGFLFAVYTILIVSGVYFAVSFYIRDDSKETGGPSAVDGAIMGGVLLAGIGACGFIYGFTEDVTITAVCIIAVMIAASATMIIRNRKYL